MHLLISGHWYVSKVAAEKAKALRLAADPHLTPDGSAVLIFDARGPSIEPYTDPEDGQIKTRVINRPAAFVAQADHGHDLMQSVTEKGGTALRLERVEFTPDDLPDLHRLVEYDHLPESRKDPAVPKGTKLA